MGRRIESQTLDREYEQAARDGRVTECIGRKCMSWYFCSHDGKRKIPGCNSDLSTDFFHRIADMEKLDIPNIDQHYNPYRTRRKKKKS